MKILQVSTSDRGGGAEGSARNLFEAFRRRGHASWLAVGTKAGDDPDVVEIPRPPTGSLGRRMLQRAASRARALGSRVRGARQAARWLDRLATPGRMSDWWAGREEFAFPGSRDLLGAVPDSPDIIHCHNLHGWYFDLSSLTELSRRVPVILNLRDAWLLTGHCAYPMDCERWRTGCGICPDLRRYPAVRRDATAENWERKARIFAESRLHITAPSTWLLDCARDSMLQGVDFRMIPNGIDLSCFRPGDRDAARDRLGLPPDRPIVLFASASRRNVYKDPGTMVETIRELAADSRLEAVSFVCLGARAPLGALKGVAVKWIPFQRDPQVVADHYRAADVFIHTARAEAFGKTVTEAMACGTPVVASDVGGIPDQIVDGKTGFLVPVADARATAAAVVRLLLHPELRVQQGRAAAERGALFSLDAQVQRFLDWYREILEHGQ